MPVGYYKSVIYMTKKMIFGIRYQRNDAIYKHLKFCIFRRRNGSILYKLHKLLVILCRVRI